MLEMTDIGPFPWSYRVCERERNLFQGMNDFFLLGFLFKWFHPKPRINVQANECDTSLVFIYFHNF